MREAKRSKRTRRKFTGEFKAKVALEAIKSQETINQVAGRYEVHPHQVTQWKQQLLRQASAAFEQPLAAKDHEGVEETTLRADRPPQNGTGVVKKKVGTIFQLSSAAPWSP
jgi:transposase